ncbi:MAG: DUF4340 domain-containing protein [Candidatus Omnitrophota bacterium]
MKPKQIIVLSIIFGILAAGILLKSLARSAGDNAGAAQGGRVAFARFDPAKLERITIRHGNQSPVVELANENGIWKVKSLWGAQADPVKVEALIEKLRSAQGELRGSGKKLFTDFGIQDAEAFSMQLFGAGNVLLLDLRLGTQKAGENGYFMRQAKSENVYLVDANMEELLGIFENFKEAVPASAPWADLRLFNLDTEKVTEVAVFRIQGEEKTRVAGLKRETDPKDPLKISWKFLRQDVSSLPDPDKVLKFIAAMNSIQAQKVVDPGGPGYGLEKPVWQLAVIEESKKTFLNAGSKDEKAELLYVARSGNSTVFGLQASFFDDLNVDDTHFLKDAPPVAETKKDISQDISTALQEEQEQAAPPSAGGQVT